MTNMFVEPPTDSWLPTRQSLLSRLRDWEDQAGWREFFERYWRLIYNVACRSGLGDAEAQDVVQNTFIYLSRRMPRFHYNRQCGSFKSWLRVVTRSRISVYRRREMAADKLMRDPLPLPDSESEASNWIEGFPDPSGDVLDRQWQREWEENLVRMAMRELRQQVGPRQLLIFRLGTLGDLPLGQVAKKLGVSVAQVYLARHRVGKLFKAEVQRLRRETE
jgi:RNA polymerase sigma factor (sigma-70 family)